MHAHKDSRAYYKLHFMYFISDSEIINIFSCVHIAMFFFHGGKETNDIHGICLFLFQFVCVFVCMNVKRRVKFYAVSVFVACLFCIPPTVEQRAISEDIKYTHSLSHVCVCVLLHIP